MCVCVYVHVLYEHRMYIPHLIRYHSEYIRLGINGEHSFDLSIKMLQIHVLKFMLLNFIKNLQVPCFRMGKIAMLLWFYFTLFFYFDIPLYRHLGNFTGLAVQNNTLQTSLDSVLALLTTVTLLQTHIHLDWLHFLCKPSSNFMNEVIFFSVVYISYLSMSGTKSTLDEHSIHSSITDLHYLLLLVR